MESTKSVPAPATAATPGSRSPPMGAMPCLTRSAAAYRPGWREQRIIRTSWPFSESRVPRPSTLRLVPA